MLMVMFENFITKVRQLYLIRQGFIRCYRVDQRIKYSVQDRENNRSGSVTNINDIIITSMCLVSENDTGVSRYYTSLLMEELYPD